MVTLTLLNFALNVVLAALIVVKVYKVRIHGNPRAWFTPKNKPIRHLKVHGTPTRVQSAGFTYYHRRTANPGEPFLARYFREDGVVDRKRIPADSYYVSQTGAVVAGDHFRMQYEEALVGEIVQGQNSPMITSRLDRAPTRCYTTLMNVAPEDEEGALRLAEEYDLDHSRLIEDIKKRDAG
jgi:hypothetical protein